MPSECLHCTRYSSSPDSRCSHHCTICSTTGASSRLKPQHAPSECHCKGLREGGPPELVPECLPQKKVKEKEVYMSSSVEKSELQLCQSSERIPGYIPWVGPFSLNSLFHLLSRISYSKGRHDTCQIVALDICSLPRQMLCDLLCLVTFWRVIVRRAQPSQSSPW